MKILIEESVLRQALEALGVDALQGYRDSITAEISAALDIAEKVEPVAWLYKDTYGKLKVSQIEEHDEHDFPVFTHPAPTTLVDSLAEKIAIATREIEGWKAVADAGEKIIAARDEQIAELEEKIKQQIRFRGDALRERDEWKREFKAAYKRETDAEDQLATVTAERDELVADAKRYRWLRHVMPWSVYEHAANVGYWIARKIPETEIANQLDAVIEAALAKLGAGATATEGHNAEVTGT